MGDLKRAFAPRRDGTWFATLARWPHGGRPGAATALDFSDMSVDKGVVTGRPSGGLVQWAMLVVALITRASALSAYGAQPPWMRADKCTDNGFQALSNIDAIHDWPALHNAYSRFKVCDDGAIAEGWSDIVGRLLTEQWKTLPTLNLLTQADKGFERFVLFHIGEELSLDEAALIVKNAQTRCPAGAKRLCRVLIQAAKGATAPSFEDFAVTSSFTGKPAAPDLTSHPQAPHFRTVLRQESSRGPNFAAHYTVVQIGCGTGCNHVAVVDARSGKVFFPHRLSVVHTARWWHEPFGLKFLPSSRLAIVYGQANSEDAPFGISYFEWTGRDFKLLRFEPRDPGKPNG